jgi:hypothetical protein
VATEGTDGNLVGPVTFTMCLGCLTHSRYSVNADVISLPNIFIFVLFPY